MIHIGLRVEPVYGCLVLLVRRVHGEDEEVANRGRVYEVAPEAMRKFGTVVVDADVLKEAFASMYFQGLLAESRCIKKPVAWCQRAIQIEVEGNQIPGKSLGLAEVGIGGYDGALLAGFA
jgi:hypothetical protein